ncbi:MAG: ribosome biogenesis GTP-binding protein YihA/YsxC [Myxococcota bacterium]
MSRGLVAEHLTAAAGPEGFPRPDLPEVALLGRSNVGKSSLLNRLVGRRRLAHTSRTPGKTRLVHFYRVERGGAVLLLVDLPGYGFAQVSRAERKSWRGLVEGYLGDRPTLRLAVLLQDLRRDASADESELLAWLAEREIPALVALTKADKLKPMRRAARVRELRGQLGLDAARLVTTSAQDGLGMPELWRAVEHALRAGSAQRADP